MGACQGQRPSPAGGASGTQLAKSENGAGATDSASTKNSGTAAVKVIVEVRYYSGGTGATNGKYSLKLSY